MKGIKATQDNLEPQGSFDLPATGPALRIVTQDGRNPENRNIPITNRTDHSSKESTSMGQSTSPSPEIGKIGNGPTSK